MVSSRSSSSSQGSGAPSRNPLRSPTRSPSPAQEEQPIPNRAAVHGHGEGHGRRLIRGRVNLTPLQRRMRLADLCRQAQELNIRVPADLQGQPLIAALEAGIAEVSSFNISTDLVGQSE